MTCVADLARSTLPAYPLWRRVVAVAIACALLTACGRKGDLEVPPEEPAQAPATPP
jgi:Prokaryotic lipoprotein-attachment site